MKQGVTEIICLIIFQDVFSNACKYDFQIKMPIHLSFYILLHVNHLINKLVFSTSVCNIINIC